MARNHRTGQLHYSTLAGAWKECWANQGYCPYMDHREDDRLTRTERNAALEEDLKNVISHGGGSLEEGRQAEPVGTTGIYRVGSADSQRYTYFDADGKRLKGNDARRARALAAAHMMTKTPSVAAAPNDQSTESATLDWNARPWKDRKEDLRDYAKSKLHKWGIYNVEFKWSRAETRWGAAGESRNALTGARTGRQLLVSEMVQDLDEKSAKGVILHEVAHLKAGINAGHGHLWEKACEEVDEGQGIVHNAHTYTMNDAERERSFARMEAERDELQNRSPWIGKCPQGHQFPSRGKPRNGYACATGSCKDLPIDQRVLTYGRRAA